MEVARHLRTFLEELKVAGHVVKEFLSDNGGEFQNEQITEILNKHGVHQILIMPYTPQKHVCSESDNRTIVETARAMMHARE